MTESSIPLVLIIAPPGASCVLSGVSLLERMLRIVRGLGFGEGIVLSTPEPTRGDVLDAAKSGGRVLVIFADFYCDARLLRALGEAQTDSILVDKSPPRTILPLWGQAGSHSFRYGPCAASLSRASLTESDRFAPILPWLISEAEAGRIAPIEAGQQPDYIPDMRRSLRPVFFPSPSPECLPLAERVLIDATQKGVLDFPALVHAPIEKWIVSHLCRTAITPNQITLGTGLLGIGVTFLYGTGHLWAGAILALCIGILDGVDGKLARLKVQMTKAGKAEHVLDYFVEMSWWAALAYHFQATGEVLFAGALWLLFYGCDLTERIAKWFVRQKIRRTLDDFSSFDRVVRVIAGRRNIYTWLFAVCLLIGRPSVGFVLICGWGIATAGVHILRALQIRLWPGPAFSGAKFQ